MPLVVLPSHKLTSPPKGKKELVTGSFFYIMSRGGICEEGNICQDLLASFGNNAPLASMPHRGGIAKTGKGILKNVPLLADSTPAGWAVDA